MESQKTAAGETKVIKSAFCEKRGNTRVFLGILADGRFVVASRFQVEIRTADQTKAESCFAKLCNG